MTNDNYSIRTMHRKELDLAINWAALEGWNPGFRDADAFYASDPGGFLIGLLNDKPISTISAVRYGDSFGFIGFYIVKPEYRGKGYGLQIWNAGMKQVEGRTVGLDGVIDQQHNYKKSGFELAYRNIRYEGRSNASENERDPAIVPLSEYPFNNIEKYDRAFFPEERTAFLKKWVDQKDGKAVGYVKNGRLKGYGVLRKCRSGYKIGPLFADDYEIASTLFSALTSDLEDNDPYYLDIPEVNSSALALVDKYNMEQVFETARMYKGEFPELPLDRLYGVTTFELG